MPPSRRLLESVQYRAFLSKAIGQPITANKGSYRVRLRDAVWSTFTAEAERTNFKRHESGSHHRAVKHKQAAIIAGVLGGVLALLFGLILIVYWRRRRQGNNAQPDPEMPLSTRLANASDLDDAQSVMPLYSKEGKIKGQAVVLHEGQAGWSYMSYVGRLGTEHESNAEA
jgi:hypothetical protein